MRASAALERRRHGALGVHALTRAMSSLSRSDPANRALIGGIVAFARGVGCKVVAEGVRTPGEAQAVRLLGVGLGQGFLFGRPERLDQIAVDG